MEDKKTTELQQEPNISQKESSKAGWDWQEWEWEFNSNSEAYPPWVRFNPKTTKPE